VNVAARIVAKAPPSGILASEQMRAAIADYRGFEPLGEVELKGRAARMAIFSANWNEFPIE